MQNLGDLKHGIYIINDLSLALNADLKQFLFNLSMFQNYIGVENLDGVYWTLFVEMKFYIFIIHCIPVNNLKLLMTTKL